MPNTQPNQNNQTNQNKQAGFGQQDKAGNNMRKDEPTSKNRGEENPSQSPQRR